MRQTPLSIHFDTHAAARVIAGRSYPLAYVLRAAYRLGRSIWDATRPDLHGGAIPRATPSMTIVLPEPWLQWPATAWAPSACARWCVTRGLPLIAASVAAGVPLAERRDAPCPPGVLLHRAELRIVYPLRQAKTKAGVRALDAYADSHGYRIEWESEIESVKHASCAIVAL